MSRSLLFMLAALLLPLTGCGVKGPLKRPSDIRQEQLKKEQERQDRDISDAPAGAPADAPK